MNSSLGKQLDSCLLQPLGRLVVDGLERVVRHGVVTHQLEVVAEGVERRVGAAVKLGTDGGEVHGLHGGFIGQVRIFHFCYEFGGISV